MSKRQFEAGEPELMDRPDASPAELESALKSLWGLNRYFGSYRIVSLFLRRWMKPRTQMRVLDLATGSADIPRLIADYAREIGAGVEIVAVDFQPSTVEMARRWSTDYPEISCECADVLTFNAPERLNLVICSLALHHFSNEDAPEWCRQQANDQIEPLGRHWKERVRTFAGNLRIICAPSARHLHRQ